MWRSSSHRTYRTQTRQWETDRTLNETAGSMSENRTGCLTIAYKWAVITELTYRGNRVSNIAEFNITLWHYCSKAYKCVMVIGLMFLILVTVNTQDRQWKYKINVRGRSRNHCGRGKAICITYSKCVCVCVCVCEYVSLCVCVCV
jgi:hypothetical protein